MSHLAIAVLGYASAVWAGQTPAEGYAEAHRQAYRTGKPILVMVSAPWCAPCQAMKKRVLPECHRRGLLQRVCFAIVDVQRERKLARRLIGNGPVPQLVMYCRTASGWKRRRLVGGQSVESVEQFVQQAVTAPEPAAARGGSRGRATEKPKSPRTDHSRVTRPLVDRS